MAARRAAHLGRHTRRNWSYYRQAQELKPDGVDMPAVGWMGGLVGLLLISSVMACVLLFTRGPVPIPMP